MIDVINQDALDKLVNMEVIQQQAKKEDLYPSDQQKQDLVTQAKLTDLKGQSFDDFLKANSITAQQYEENVVRNVVYAVVASKHMPDNASEDERNNAFITWICSTRAGYDVKINLTFTVENKPCTSGLPSDIPLGAVPAGGGTEVPQDVPTTAPQVPQGATPAPNP